MKALVRALWADKLTFVALVLFLLILVGSLIGPWLLPHSPTAQNLLGRNLPPFSPHPRGEFPHILGTDQLGRDLLARLLAAGRVSLFVAFIGVIISGIAGTLAGVSAGYFGGRVDNAVMRLADMQLALPFLLVAVFVLFVFGRGMTNVIIILAIERWPVYARISRSFTLQVKSQAYIDGARVIGCSEPRIVFRHVIPNLLSPMVVLGTLEIARLILAESTLSFLGLGIQPPDSSWGLMVSQGRNVLGSAPWNVWLPGLFIFLTALSVTLLATWVRAVTDPTQRWRWLQAGGATSPIARTGS